MSKSAFSKKQLAKLSLGTWITISWNDAPDEAVLLVEYIDTREKGDCRVTFYAPGRGVCRAVHTQIVGIQGSIAVPFAGRGLHY